MQTYEIYNLTTSELLADNLTFDDMPELYGAYLDFYPNDDIIVCCREVKITVTYARIINQSNINRKQFNSEWLALMDELFVMGNISYGGA